MPRLDHAPDPTRDAESPELSQTLDRRHAWVVQLELLTLFLRAFLPVDRLVRDGRPLAMFEVHRAPGLAASPPAAAKHLPSHDDPALLHRDLNVVCRQPSATLPEPNRDLDRAVAAPRHQLAISPAPGHGYRDVTSECVLEEAEHVEERRLPRPVRTHDDPRLSATMESDTTARTTIAPVLTARATDRRHRNGCVTIWADPPLEDRTFPLGLRHARPTEAGGTTMPEILSLKPVGLREVWPKEADDFTPWLAKNIERLGAELDLRFGQVSTEVTLPGAGRVDIHAEQVGTGARVVIENQLEDSDDGHCLRLLGYAARAEASILVWVARSFSSYHRSILEWLNDADTIHVYALSVRAYRVGDALTANFETVIAPRQSQPTASHPAKSTTNFNTLSAEFYRPLVERLRRKGIHPVGGGSSFV